MEVQHDHATSQGWAAMTLPAFTAEQTLLGDGYNREFDFSFTTWHRAGSFELAIILTSPSGRTKDVTAHSHVVLSGTRPGGKVTYPKNPAEAPLAAGWKLSIVRDMYMAQEMHFSNASRLDPPSLETLFDRIVAMIQQLAASVRRTLQIPLGADTTPEEFLDSLFVARDEAVDASGQAKSAASNAAQSASNAAQSARDAKEQFDRVQQEGDRQFGRVQQEGHRQVDCVRATGSAEVIRIQKEGSRYVANAAQEADRAHKEADRAEHVAQVLPNIGNAAMCFFAFTMDDAGTLFLTQSRDGDVLQQSNFICWDIFPATSRLYLDNGTLVLELPFQPSA